MNARSGQPATALTLDDLDVIAWYTAFDEDLSTVELTDEDLDAVAWLQAEPPPVVPAALPQVKPLTIPPAAAADETSATPSIAPEPTAGWVITDDAIVPAASASADPVGVESAAAKVVEPKALVELPTVEPTAIVEPAAEQPPEPQPGAPEPPQPPTITLPDWLEAAEPGVEPTVPAAATRPPVGLPDWLFLAEPERPAQPLPDWLFLREPWDVPPPAAVVEPATPASPLQPAVETVIGSSVAAPPAVPIETTGQPHLAGQAPEPAPSVASNDALPDWLFLEETPETATPPVPSWQEEIASAISGQPPADSTAPLNIAPVAPTEESMEYDYGGAWSMVRRLRDMLAEQERIAAARAAALAAGQPLPDEIEAITQTSIDDVQSNGHSSPIAQQSARPTVEPNRRGAFSRGEAGTAAPAAADELSTRPAEQPGQRGRKPTRGGDALAGRSGAATKPRRGIFGIIGRKR